MIAGINVELLEELKCIENIWGPKFRPNGTKSGPKLSFLPFFQVWFISFHGNWIG